MTEDTFGGRIRKIVKESNLTKAAFARSLGVTPNYVYLMENDKVKKCSRMLALLIEAKYGYPADWVMEGVGPSRPAGREKK